MKISGLASARYYPDRRAIVVFPLEADLIVVEKLFAFKLSKEKKDGGNAHLEYEFEVKAREKTGKQVATVWALIGLMFEAMNARPGTKDEKQELYEDILSIYANKRPNRFTGELRPVRLSESDVNDAAALITHIMATIVEYCDLTLDLQADVRKLFYAWEASCGELDKDPRDYHPDGTPFTEAEWRACHLVSDASGVGGPLELAHIVSRGADQADIGEPWDWLMLSVDEHRYVQHQHGWSTFLDQYPHLKSRVLRARQLAAT
jgi:hypothetical protein